MAQDPSIERFERGEVLSADKLNQLRQQSLRMFSGHGSFTNNNFSVIRSLVEDSVGTDVTILLCDVFANVLDTDSTFFVDNIDLVTGTDPRPDPKTALQQIEVKNTFSLGYTADDRVFVVQREVDGLWETWHAGEGGTSKVFRCRLTQTLTLAGTEATAKLLNPDGTDVSPQQNVTVIDSEAKLVGETDYTGANGSAQKGYIVWGKKFTDDYNGTGNPGLTIVAMERPAPTIAVKILQDVSGTSLITAELLDKTNLPFAGSNFDRIPIKAVISGGTGGSTDGVAVYNTLSLAMGAKNKEKWLAVYSPQQAKYILVEPLDPGLSVIKGNTVSAVDRSDPTFDVGSLEVVRGRLPRDATSGADLTQVTVTNTPECSFSGSVEVYLTYDTSVGSNESDHWTPGRAENWQGIARGLEDYDETKELQALSNNDGDLKWVDAEFLSLQITT